MVVIGGGMAGLTVGALLAHAGKKVLVAEAEAEPGGYARAVRHGPYTFDRTGHLIFGCKETGPFGPGLIDAVLRQLGVRAARLVLGTPPPHRSCHCTYEMGDG